MLPIFCYLFVGFHMKTTTYQADRRLKRPAARCGVHDVLKLGGFVSKFWEPAEICLEIVKFYGLDV